MTRLLREHLTEPRVLAIRRGCTIYQNAVDYLDDYKKTGTYKRALNASKFDLYISFQEDVIAYEDDFIESNIRCGEYTRTSLFI